VLEVFLDGPDYKGAIKVYLFDAISEDKRVFYQNGSMSDTKEVNAYPAEERNVLPFFTIRSPHAQLLLDAFLGRGIRPDKESRTEGVLTATEIHLEDMRKLVFKDKYSAPDKKRT